MSWYTIGENWIWFLIAAILAFILGWLLHGLFRRPKTVTNTEIYVIEKELADLRLSKDASAKARIAELEAKLSGLRADATLAAPAVAVSGPSPKLVAELEAKVSDLEAKLGSVQAENDANLKLLGELTGGKVSIGDLKAGKVSIADLTASGVGVAAAAAPGASVETEADLEARLAELRAQSAADQRLIATLQAQVAAVNETPRRKRTEAEVAEARTRVAAIAKRTAGEGEAVTDDLEQIFGIGPVISEMLHSMGVTSFRQVARFDQEDIETIGDALEVFPDRITRDDWMSSARELHQKKYGTDPLAGWRGGSQIEESTV